MAHIERSIKLQRLSRKSIVTSNGFETVFDELDQRCVNKLHPYLEARGLAGYYHPGKNIQISLSLVFQIEEQCGIVQMMLMSL
jgi:hypothetical protein